MTCTAYDSALLPFTKKMYSPHHKVNNSSYVVSGLRENLQHKVVKLEFIIYE
jgi:hypothetical protein